MRNTYFSQVEMWHIRAAAIVDSLTDMAIDGRNGNEGIVLWLGRDIDEIAEVTHLVRLRGPKVEKLPDLINIHPDLLNDVADIAIANKVRMVGQVHSHGPGYSLDLSPTDREYGIQAPSYLSVVAPDYGSTTAPFQTWGIHVFIDSAYRRLPAHEVQRRIQINAGPRLPFLTVGGAE